MKKDHLHLFISEISKHFKEINLWPVFMNYGKWRASHTPGNTPITDRHPWMTFQAVAFLNKNVKPSHMIFEYGGGGSTLFFLKKGAFVKTVENDSHWFELLTKNIQENNLEKHWTGYLKTPEPPVTENLNDFANPDAYLSSSYNFKNHIFENYVKTIDQFGDLSFDFVVVDGRARPSCIKHGARKVKKGGYLILDNADRDHYVTPLIDKYLEDFELLLNSYGPCPYIDYFIKTNIWKRVR